MTHSEHSIFSGPICAFLLGIVPILCGTTEAVEISVDCRILHETIDGIYVDLGTDSGLKEGAVGLLRQSRTRVEVVKVVSGSTLLRVLSDYTPGLFTAGDEITLIYDREEAQDAAPASPTRSPTLKDPTGEEEFTPLLVTPDMREAAASEASNIFHGRFTVRQIYQLGDDSDNDYSISRFTTSGSLERIGRTAWTFEWAGQVHYRTGDELEDIRNFEEIRVEAYRLALYRRFDDRSFVRLGRFIPNELPGVGFLDGAQGEKVLSERLRVGVMLGFKPDRVTTTPSGDEPTVVTYVTYEPQTDSGLSYSGTAGLLFSLYEGDTDRLAFLWDQQARIGNLSLFSSSVVDVDVGGADVRDEVARLTWLTLNASYPVAPLLELRAGIDKYELPDTAAERDVIRYGDLILDEFFKQDTWRYWVGASHRLPGNFRLSEKISYTDSESINGWRASVEITRRGLPFLPDATLTLSAYTIRAIAVDDGFGGRLSAYLPFMRHRLSLLPAATVRYADYETRGSNFFDRFDDELWWVDISLHAQWRISKSWSIAGGVSYSTNEENRVLLDLSATFRW